MHPTLRHSLTLLALVLPLAAGCASKPKEFLVAKYAGDRAKTAGRYGEAADHYAKAALKAKRTKDRDEALYLQAATLEEAGKHKQASAAYGALVKKSPDGPRAARAAYDKAFLAIKDGKGEPAWKELEGALFRYPDLASARRALRWLIRHKEEQAKGKGMSWLNAKMSKFSESSLGEDARYRRAHLHWKHGNLVEARKGFVDVATRYPYPHGSLFDDAWWHASEVDLERKMPKLALQDLQELLGSREFATLGQGSYQRPRYSRAQFKIAEIYRDLLNNPVQARAEFHKLYKDYKTSILRDDALWEEAKLAKKGGDSEGACDLVETLVDDFPKSRYSGCGKLLCDNAKVSKDVPTCRGYIAKTVQLVRRERALEDVSAGVKWAYDPQRIFSQASN